MGTTRKLFASKPATPAEVTRAEMLLSRDGMVPVADRAGHRGALELWRRHCQRVSPSLPAMLAAVGNLLDLPRCDFDRGFAGQQQTTQLAWVRTADILITTHPDFPYHCSVEELAELASHLIAEQADPDGMAMILGEDYGLSTVAAPHGLLHQVEHNGNHRTAAIKAARFPVALVRTVHYDQPWLLPMWGARWTGFAYLRLLFRAGLLANFREVEAEGVADANHWANLLLANTAAEVLSNVAAYEQLYGRCETWPSWLREPVTLTNLLNREIFTMNGFNLQAFDDVAARWPPPPVTRLKLFVQRLSGQELDSISSKKLYGCRGRRPGRRSVEDHPDRGPRGCRCRAGGCPQRSMGVDSSHISWRRTVAHHLAQDICPTLALLIPAPIDQGPGSARPAARVFAALRAAPRWSDQTPKILVFAMLITGNETDGADHQC